MGSILCFLSCLLLNSEAGKYRMEWTRISFRFCQSTDSCTALCSAERGDSGL